MFENPVHPLEHYEKLGEIELGRGDVISTIDLASFPGDYPVYSSSAVGAGEFGRYGRFMFDEELITWSIDGGGRPFYRPKHRYSVTNVCGYLRIKKADSWNYRYLHALLENLQSGIQFDYQMKAHPSVIRELYRFGRMPIEEQQAIGEILDTLDTAIHETEALIAKLKAVKQGLLHDLLTRGIAANGELRPPQTEAPHLYKLSPLGWIPKDWVVDVIEKFLERIIDYRGKTPEKTDSGIPLLTAKNVRLGYIDLEPREFIANDKFDRWMSRGIPQKGDVLFTTEAPLGNVAQIETTDKIAFAQRMIILQAGDRIIDSFLKYLMLGQNFRSRLFAFGSGSTVEGIQQSTFRKLLIAIPESLDEQNSIVEMLIEMDAKISNELSCMEKLRLLKSGLMDDLLTGRVRVTPLLEAAAP